MQEYVYLTYYQAMSFLLEIEEMKNNNPHFNDNLANTFYDYVLQRTYEIATTTSFVKAKLFPNSTKYKISKSLFNYLTNITEINVFDEQTLTDYIILINELENEVANELIEETKINKTKKMHKF